MASFPATIKTFTTKENVVHVVDADHPNTSEAEITAIETVLGTNPHQSAARAVNYTTMDARLEAIETDYRLLTNHDSHALLVGLAGDDHTQYLRTDGTRAFTGVTAIAGVPIAVQAGDTQAAGTALTLARSDHRHAVGAAVVPTTSAVGNAAAVGASLSVARADHVHGREGFGAVTPATTYGIAAGNGAATTVARSDHTHGTPALTGATPAAEDYGSTAVVGTGALAAREDHRHAMPALGSTAAVTQAFGDAATVGIATVPARADHRHGMPALGTTVTDERTYGLAPTAGVAATASRSDHSHGSPDATLAGPSGCIAMWATNTPPSGWLVCDGAAVSRTTYSVLFGIIGTTYGTGDGSTTFNLPNLKGRVVVGRDSGDGDWDVLGETRGAKTHVLAWGEMPVHSHTIWVDANNFSTGGRSAGHVHWVNWADPVSSFQMSNHSHDVLAVDNQGPSLGLTPGSNQYAFLPRWFRTSDNIGSHQHGVGHDHGNTAGENVDHTHTANHGHTGGSNNSGSGSAHNNIQPSIVLNYIIKT